MNEDVNKILRGTFGRVWMNGERLSNVKEYEAKATLNYEDVDMNDDLSTARRYMGYSVEGTMLLHKVDSKVLKLYQKGIVSGDIPEIKFVSAIADPTVDGQERVEIYGVTFDEVTLSKFANKTLLEEEVPFKARGFHVIDAI